MKEFKIEIWIYGSITDTYTNTSINEVLKWFKENWKCCYDNGGCAFYVYEDGRVLSFNETYNLGFE